MVKESALWVYQAWNGEATAPGPFVLVWVAISFVVIATATYESLRKEMDTGSSAPGLVPVGATPTDVVHGS